MNRSELTAVLTAAGAAVSMGSIGLIARLSEADSVTVTFYRLSFGALILWFFLALIGRAKATLRWPNKVTITSGILIAAFILFYTEAMQQTTILIAVITLYAAPPVASLISHFLFNDKLSRQASMSVLVSILGFILVIQGSGEELNADLTGFLFALASMFCYCCFLLLNKCGKVGKNEWSNISWQLISGAAILAPFVLINDVHFDNPKQWLWMLAAGAIPGFMGLSLAVYAVKRLPSASYASISYLEPVTAVMLGWLIFDESLNTTQVIGASVIIINSLAELYFSSRKPLPSPA